MLAAVGKMCVYTLCLCPRHNPWDLHAHYSIQEVQTLAGVIARQPLYTHRFGETSLPHYGAGGRALTLRDHLDPIPYKERIDRDHGQVIHVGGGDNHAVARVGVDGWQGR